MLVGRPRATCRCRSRRLGGRRACARLLGRLGGRVRRDDRGLPATGSHRGRGGRRRAGDPAGCSLDPRRRRGGRAVHRAGAGRSAASHADCGATPPCSPTCALAVLSRRTGRASPGGHEATPPCRVRLSGVGAGRVRPWRCARSSASRPSTASSSAAPAESNPIAASSVLINAYVHELARADEGSAGAPKVGLGLRGRAPRQRRPRLQRRGRRWRPRSRPTWSTPCSPTAPATTSTTPTPSCRRPSAPTRAASSSATGPPS